jgi:hypothetical protein
MKLRLEGNAATTDVVDKELIRRQGAGFFILEGRIQVRDKDRSFIGMAISAARLAIDKGAKPGDFGWNGPPREFAWILADNTVVPMDAQRVVEAGSHALSYISALALSASDLKARIRSGEKIVNIERDELWPDSGPFENKTGEEDVSD